MDIYLSWFATIATIIAATITASNLGARITGYGFVIFTVGSVAWLSFAAATDQPALVWTNGVLTVLNLFGIWRWLGRQAKVEEGSKAASQASEGTPGEALFPISLLTHAQVRSASSVLGTCVDAMAGSGSGRVAYVIVSEGGIAGAGETLRRLPWSTLHVERDEVEASLDEHQFCTLEPVSRDHWPAK
jgi:hypothetical protein